MTYQPHDGQLPQGQQPPQYPHLAPPAPPRRKIGTGAIIGIAVGAVVLACCGITSVAAIVGGDTQPEAAPSPTAAAVADRVPPSSAPAVEPTTAASTTPAAPTTAAATTPPAPTAPPAPAKVTMPNLKGLNAAIADEKLRALGFTNVQYGSQDENDTVVLLLANWTVTKQSTKAGAKVSPGDLVVVTCTKQS